MGQKSARMMGNRQSLLHDTNTSLKQCTSKKVGGVETMNTEGVSVL